MGKLVELTELVCPECRRRFADVSAKRAETHLKQHAVKHELAAQEAQD